MPTLISGSTGVNKITDGTIVNADINASAAIAGSKLVMPAGSIVQVVTDTHQSASHFSTTSTSYIASQLSATITPKFTSSKILITMNMGSQCPNDSYGFQQCLRDSTVLGGEGWGGTSQGDALFISHTCNWVDTPSTTSATTYQIKVKAQSGTYYYHHADRVSTLILMEIAG